jgi:DNA-binding Lrp family transcriptional regulator
VVHGLVEFRDGSVVAQLGPPDMRVPIAHCLAWPARIDGPAPRLDLAALRELTFEEPDLARFPALGLARQAMLGVRVHGDSSLAAQALAALPEVSYVVLTAGSFDLLVEVVCRSDEHLLEVINARIRTVPEVASLESFMYLELAKQTYTWGVS